MIPRRDPDTRPVAISVQTIRRPRSDEYGAERPRKDAPLRLMSPRNGLSVRPYKYRGTGQSMTENEAEWWLRTTFSNTKDCTECDL